MPGRHATYSPSGSHRWIPCAGSIALEAGLPDTAGRDATEGTAAHELAAMALESGLDARAYHGRIIDLDDGSVEVTDEMIEAVQVYLDLVRSFVAQGGELHVEVELPLDSITGEEGAVGTADAVILMPNGTIVVIDLKYGRGVEVSAVGNPQLMMYALAAVRHFGLVAEITDVVVMISQPRILRVASEDRFTVAELEGTFARNVAGAVERCQQAIGDFPPAADRDARIIWEQAYLEPGEEQCKFCRAKATCPALADAVADALEAEFTDLTTESKVEQESLLAEMVPTAILPDDLGAKMAAVPLIEMWCKAIRARAEARLLDGHPVPGFKLVAGRRGARAWTDAKRAEAELKAMRLKREQMYEHTLISPTTAEKLLKASPKRWARVAPLISQGEGKPSVAPVSDKRPALEVKAIETEFTVITEAGVEALL